MTLHHIAIFAAVCAMSATATVRSESASGVTDGFFVSADAQGKVLFAVQGHADYDLPQPSTPGLSAFCDALTTATGIKTDGGSLSFNYLPGDNGKSVGVDEFQAALQASPATAYSVEAVIAPVADTPHYLSSKASTLTKSLLPDGYDITTLEFVNYNKDTDAVIDYFDVFNASAERRLREMIYPVLAKKYPVILESSDELEIVPNFALTPQGVIFAFPESSVADASAGCPQVSLTWQQLRSGRCLAEGAEALTGN